MSKQEIIEKTIRAINELPEEKGEEIADFADFLFKRFEEKELSKDLRNITTEGKSFDYLYEEEDLYKLSDLKQIYNA